MSEKHDLFGNIFYWANCREILDKLWGTEWLSLGLGNKSIPDGNFVPESLSNISPYFIIAPINKIRKQTLLLWCFTAGKDLAHLYKIPFVHDHMQIYKYIVSISFERVYVYICEMLNVKVLSATFEQTGNICSCL